MTQFEQAVQDVKDGKLKTPSVSSGGKNIDYFGYQISVHLFNMKIFASGMTMKGAKFTPIKKYYGLKGRSAKECLPELQKIADDYKESLK